MGSAPILDPSGRDPRRATIVRNMRIFCGVFLVWMIGIIGMGEWLPPQPGHGEAFPTFYYAFGALCSVLGGVSFFMRTRLQAALEAGVEDRAQVAKAWVSFVVAIALAESIVLFGFVMRFFGGKPTISYGFYAVGIALIVLLFPPT